MSYHEEDDRYPYGKPVETTPQRGALSRFANLVVNAVEARAKVIDPPVGGDADLDALDYDRYITLRLEAGELRLVHYGGKAFDKPSRFYRDESEEG